MFDYLIKNANVVDGTGAPAYRASVAVSGDTISAIIRDGDPLPEATAVIDAKGKLLTPGFIDIHSHADFTLTAYPEADSSIMQGITTFVGGNCGHSLAPAHSEEYVESMIMGRLGLRGVVDVKWRTFKDWLDLIRTLPLGCNYIPLVGHSALRGSVLGDDSNLRISTPEEEEDICDLLHEALDAGAFGMTYIADPGYPGHWASANEMKKLFKVLEGRGSYVSAHTRHHQNQWPSDDGRNYYGVFIGENGEVLCGRYHGFVEFMELLETTPNLTAVYSHLTSAFLTPMPHSQALEDALIDETLRIFVDEPIEKGRDIYFCAIPNPASIGNIQRVAKDLTRSMVFDAELKDYATEESLISNLPDPHFRQKLKKCINSGKYKMGMLCPATDPYWSDCFTIFIAKDESLVNRTLMDIAKEHNPGISRHDLVYSACMEVLFDLVTEDPDLEWALTIDKREYQGINRLFQHPRCMPMTDTPVLPASMERDISIIGGNPPCAYSLFVQFLTDMCRDQGLIPMEEAFRRMTSLPADIMRISDRGRIAVGNKADLILLDWEKLGYTTDFANPSTPPSGIDYVFVNGVPALEKGTLTHACTGEVLTRNKA